MFRFLLLLSYLTFTSATFHPRHLRSHLHSHPISSPSTSTSASRPCPGSAADAIQLPRDLGVHPDYDIDYFYWTGTLYAPDCTTVNITSPSIDPLRTPCLYHYSIIFGQITSVKLAMMWIQLNTDPDNIIIHTQHTTPFFVDTSIQPWNVNAYDYLSNPPQYNFKWTTINNTVDVGSVGAEYQMSVTTPSYSWDLTFIQQEPMFGYGDHGYVNLDNVTCTCSYYFALPHLQQTSGSMTFNHPNQPSTSFTTVGQSYFERQYRIQPGGANGTGEAHWDWLYASVGDYQYGLMCAVPTTSFCGITICSISGRVPCQYNVAAHMSYISTHTINEHDIPIKSYVHIDTTPPMRLLMEPRFLNVDDSDLYDQYVTVTNIDTQEIGMGYAEYIRGKVA